MIKSISILTSGRADFSHYLPVIKELVKDQKYRVKLVVFGSHLSSIYVESLNEIINNEVKIFEKIDCQLIGDSPESISSSMGITTLKFSKYWANNSNDIALVLGDRFEMLSAALASVPFNIKIAHLHGGETSLGAIDNYFRDALTSISTLHFTSTEEHKNRVIQIKGNKKNVYNTGAPGLTNLKNLKLQDFKSFLKIQKLSSLEKSKFVLITLHPETVYLDNNNLNISIIESFIKNSEINFLFTTPNTDTNHSFLLYEIKRLEKLYDNVFLRNSLGVTGYYTALENCLLTLGNSSSGIVESASFKKYNINIGKRQEGRSKSDNNFDAKNFKDLMNAFIKIKSNPVYLGTNIYFKKNCLNKIKKELYAL